MGTLERRYGSYIFSQTQLLAIRSIRVYSVTDCSERPRPVIFLIPTEIERHVSPTRAPACYFCR